MGYPYVVLGSLFKFVKEVKQQPMMKDAEEGA